MNAFSKPHLTSAVLRTITITTALPLDTPTEMSNLEVNLTWSVQLQPDVLIAYLGAFLELRKTLSALRLCHRYGQGEQAAINRLPVEVLTHIESFLVEERRSVLLTRYQKNFKCYQGLCRPRDHMPRNEILELATIMRTNQERPMVEEATDQELEAVDKQMHEMVDAGWEPSWYSEHTSSASCWSSFSKSKDNMHYNLQYICLMHFGLGIWTVNRKTPKVAAHQREVRNAYWSSEAYLTMPTRSYLHVFDRPDCHEDESGMDEGPWRDEEDGLGVGVVMPKSLSDSDAARFKRALAILGLGPADVMRPKTGPRLSADTDLLSLADVKRPKDRPILPGLGFIDLQDYPSPDRPKIEREHLEQWMPQLRLLVNNHLDFIDDF